jgi:hypothetical protein
LLRLSILATPCPKLATDILIDQQRAVAVARVRLNFQDIHPSGFTASAPANPQDCDLKNRDHRAHEFGGPSVIVLPHSLRPSRSAQDFEGPPEDEPVPPFFVLAENVSCISKL